MGIFLSGTPVEDEDEVASALENESPTKRIRRE